MAPTYSKPCHKSASVDSKPGCKSKSPDKGLQLDALLIATQTVRPAIDALLAALDESVSGCNVAVKQVGQLLDWALQSSSEALSCCSSGCSNAWRWLGCAFARAAAPPLLGSLPIMFVMYILVLLYNAFVFAYLPAAGLAINSPTSLVFHALIFMVLSSFSQAVNTDPGSTPQEEKWKQKGAPPPEVSERKQSSGEARWCRNTGAYKPDRAHHCQAEGRVVLRMDHYCPWIGNTVGFANHKFFFLLLFYTNAACGMLNISLLELITHIMLPSLTKFLLIGSLGVSTLLLTLLGPFLIFHCWLLGRNMTSVELSQQRRQQEEAGCPSSWFSTVSPYDLGLYGNICSVLGANPLLWFFPIGRPQGDGLRFPTLSGDSPQLHDSVTHHEEEEEKEEREEEEVEDTNLLEGTEASEQEDENEVHHHQSKSRQRSSLALLGAALKQETSSPAVPLNEATDTREARDSINLEEGRTSAPGHNHGWQSGRPMIGAAGAAWEAASELTDDFRVGCEFVGEGVREGCGRVKKAAVHSAVEAVIGLGDAMWRFTSVCSSSLTAEHKKKGSSKKQSSKATSEVPENQPLEKRSSKSSADPSEKRVSEKRSSKTSGGAPQKKSSRNKTCKSLTEIPEKESFEKCSSEKQSSKGGRRSSISTHAASGHGGLSCASTQVSSGDSSSPSLEANPTAPREPLLGGAWSIETVQE